MIKYKRLVYNLGSEAGFFSEFNNMVLAIIFCEKYGIEFKLFSTGSKLSNDIWNDYFIPFCKSSTNFLNAHFNSRQPDFIPDSLLFKTGSSILRIIQNGYLTYDLWKRFRSTSFTNDSFPINGTLMNMPQACHSIISRIWKYNPVTQTEIQNRIDSLKIPSEYVGMHIRRGDKCTEISHSDYDAYFAKIEKHSNCRNLFIATDDYSVIDDISRFYPQFSIFSLSNSCNRGYNHSAFIYSDHLEKRESLLQLFAEIELLASSAIAIGTYSSNIGMYLGMRMGSNRFFGIDFDRWQIW